jgi:hypothetical protein
MLAALVGAAAPAAAATAMQGDFVVIANRATDPISFTVSVPSAGDAAARKVELAAGGVMPLVIMGGEQLTFAAAGQRRTYRLVPNNVYYFGNTSPGVLDLGQIGSAASDAVSRPATRRDSAIPAPGGNSTSPAPLVIPVKILRDDNEFAADAAWERRLRARFDEASRIFEKYCFVRFQIVAIDQWHSSDAITDLDAELREFERLVDPGPARLAIGFTGQNKLQGSRMHLGGTRGPLGSHLIVREWAARHSEAERLELLVHELGHFLGAVHSPEPHSAMRILLGDRQARAVKFQIGFDPLNTLALCLVVQELRAGPDVRLAAMRRQTQLELRRIYTELAHALPDDPSGPQFLRALALPALGAR